MTTVFILNFPFCLGQERDDKNDKLWKVREDWFRTCFLEKVREDEV